MVSAANLLNESSNFQQKTHPGLVLSKLNDKTQQQAFPARFAFSCTTSLISFSSFSFDQGGGPFTHSLLHEGDEAHQLVVVWKPKGQDSKTIPSPSLLFEKA